MNDNKNNENNNIEGDFYSDSSKTHNVELILKNAEDEKEIDFSYEFGKIFSRFKSKKAAFVKSVLIFLVIGIAAGIAKPFFVRTNSVTAAIMFGYDGIDKGLAPDGSFLDISKIKSNYVVEQALINSGMQDVSAQSVMQHISVVGVVPSSVANKKMVMSEFAQKDLKTATELIEMEYTASEYILRFNYRSLGISQKKACDILNAVLEEYRDYFYDAYYKKDAIKSSIDVIDISSYDYEETLNIFETQSEVINEYLDRMINKTNNFVSPSLHIGYSDIQYAVQVMDNVDIAKVFSMIYTYNITQDRHKLGTYYEYLIEQETRNLNEALENKNAIQNSLDKYEKNPIIIAGSEEQSNQINNIEVSGTIYDSLIQRNIESSRRISEIEKRINKYKSRLEMIQDTESSSQRMNNYEEMRAAVEKEIKNISDKFDKYIGYIGTITSEYYESQNYNNSYRITVPAMYVGGIGVKGIIVSAAKWAAIGAAAGFALMLLYQGLAVYIPFDILLEKKNKAVKKTKIKPDSNKKAGK